MMYLKCKDEIEEIKFRNLSLTFKSDDEIWMLDKDGSLKENY